MRALFSLIALSLILSAFAQTVPCDVNKCTFDSATETTTITFGGTSYTPSCVRVASGTVVTFSGPFGTHPLRSGIYDAGTGNETPFAGTIVDTSSGDTASFNMTIDGANPFFCNVHKSLGMVGVIYVGTSCATPVAPTTPTAATPTTPTATTPTTPTAATPTTPTAPSTYAPVKKSSAVAVQVGALSLLAVFAL